ncbi:uncharacterized protein LOC116212061 isoform X2 [Punica granatum]|uniref:Uncharacterized protein LOC116212061 isoform X2 n=1 Tax=Punica granatum TaxID=22663 RepID=A0A6P8EB70_PUNGR|nr:uncharacterized protein LOC116212061 isoform X2 [Punica granatum]
MGSSAETRSGLTNSKFYMENVLTTCNVRVKRCSTLTNSSPVSSAGEHNGSLDGASKERAFRQGSVVNPDLLCPSMKSSDSDGQCSNADTSNLLNASSSSELGSQNSSNTKISDDTSCISGLDTANTAAENRCNNAERKNDGSGSSASVNSFPSSEKAVNDQQNILYKTSRNSEESGSNHGERSMKDSETSKVDFPGAPTPREPSPKGEASVLFEEKGESSSTTTSFKEAAEISKHPETKECKEKQCRPMEQPYITEIPLPSQPADNNSGADTADEDVRVCDICGDAGHEGLLAICTKCNDGAEHIYCMHIKMDKVPAGDWVCEDCEISQESGRERQKELEEAEKALKRSYSIDATQRLGSLGPSNLKKKLQVDADASDFEKRTAKAVSCSSKLSSKITSGNSEASPITKRRISETRDKSSRVSPPQKVLFRNCTFSSPTNMAEGKVKPLPLGGSTRSTFSVGLLKSRSFNIGDTRVKDHRPKEGSERSIIIKDHGKESRRIFCKSQSFKDAHTKFSGPDISIAKKMLSSTSPRVKDRIRVRQIEDQSSSPPKSVPKLGSLNADNNNIARNGELTSKHSAVANNHDQKRIRGYEHLSTLSKSRMCPPHDGSGDQHVENQIVVNNAKAEQPYKANELDVNRFTRRPCLDNLVPSPRSVIPLADFLWKGGFEVSRSGGLTSLFPWIQAHKSNHASDKVDGVMSKFPQKIVLDEVPRSSMWPTQFTDTQVMENNIAVFFFAENHESYGTYKSLLKHLIVNDLALKGYVDGVELLIFSSKVLPPESQRMQRCWNNLMFLWGAFRITGVNSPENEPTSRNGHCSPGPRTGSSEPHTLVTKEMLSVGQPKTELFPSNRNHTSLQTSNLNGLPFASSKRVYEIPEPVASSSEPKVSPMPANNHQLRIFNSSLIYSPGEEKDLCKSRGLDLNLRDPPSSSSYDEERPNRKMKGIVNALPEPCSLKIIRFFEVAPLFYTKDLASTSGESSIARDKGQSTLEDVNLELSLGPINLSGKRKVSSLSFEAVDCRAGQTKRLQKDEDELSLSVSLSLAPPS